MTDYKFYIWEDVFTGYTPGIAAAVARSPNEARHKIVDYMSHQDEPMSREEAEQHYTWKRIGYPPDIVKDVDEPFGVGVWGGG